MRKSKSFFKLSTASLALLHCINKFVDYTAVSKNTKPNGNFYHWKHGDIFYKKQGEGEPLLLIHDLNVFSSIYEWSQVIDALSLDYTVYAIDLIGCGKSDKPEITYTNYFYVQMISDFVNDVIGKGIKVAATGLSSSFVLMANSIHKDMFKEIMMISPKPITALRKSPNDRSRIILGLFNLPIIGKAAYYVATCRPNTEYYLTEKCFYNPFHVNASTVTAFYNAAHTSDGKGKSLLASLEGYYVNIDITKAIKTTDTRIVIVVGEENENGKEIINNYKKYNPNITAELIPNTKYLPQLEDCEYMTEVFYHF